MKTGETIRIIKGPHAGEQATINSTAGFFYHVQLLTPDGKKASDGLISLHRSAIEPVSESVQSRA